MIVEIEKLFDSSSFAVARRANDSRRGFFTRGYISFMIFSITIENSLMKYPSSQNYDQETPYQFPRQVKCALPGRERANRAIYGPG